MFGKTKQEPKYQIIQIPKSHESMIKQELSGKYRKIDGDQLIEGEFDGGEQSGRWVYYDKFGNTSAFNYIQTRVGAICMDGSFSSATGRGACSWHGGVSQWLYGYAKYEDNQYFSSEQEKFAKAKKDALQIYQIKNSDEKQALYQFFKKAVKVHKTNEIYKEVCRQRLEKIEQISVLKQETLLKSTKQKQKIKQKQKTIIQYDERIKLLEENYKQVLEKLTIFEQSNNKLQIQLKQENQRNYRLIQRIQKILDKLISPSNKNKNQNKIQNFNNIQLREDAQPIRERIQLNDSDINIDNSLQVISKGSIKMRQNPQIQVL